MGDIVEVYGEVLLLMFVIVGGMTLLGFLWYQYSSLITTILNSIFIS